MAGLGSRLWDGEELLADSVCREWFAHLNPAEIKTQQQGPVWVRVQTQTVK